MRRRMVLCAWVLGVLAPALAAAATRLEYRGSTPTRREAEVFLQASLRQPRDSVALAAALVAMTGRLQQQGWLDAHVHAELDTTTEPVLRLDVREGPRYRWGVVNVLAPTSGDSAALARGLLIRTGGWASPQEATLAVDRALHAIADHGHPYAELGVTGWDADSGRVRLTLSGALGPLVTVSAARIEGLRVTRTAFASRPLARLVGAPYDRAAAEAARDRLAQLGVFRSVTLRDLEGEGDWSRARLVYRVEEPRYNQFEGVVGVQGNAGTVGLARLDLGNLFGTGRSAGVRWESRGHGVANFAAHLAEPLVFNTPLRLEGALEQQVEDTLYVRTRWGAKARIALSGQERLEAGYEQERVVQEHGEVEEAQLQNTVFSLERSTLDDPLGPRHGSRTQATAAQIFKRETLRPTGDRTARASAVELVGEWHRPLRGNAGLSLDLRAAGRFSSQRVLPIFERYPLGGAATLRGHDEEEFRVDRYALSRFEWRWFLGPGAQRVFLFWDHAWMETRLPRLEGGDRFSSAQRDGLGFGLRLDTAGGLVGVDYGLEPGRAPLEGKIHLQLISTF
jgi:outer membrane protein assembly factor BamA